MRQNRKGYFLISGYLVSLLLSLPIATTVAAQVQTTSTTDATPTKPKSTSASANVFFSPASQTILEGSTFDVSVFLNTNKSSINALELAIKFPPSKLQIVKPSSGKSLIQLWLVPPAYSQVDGNIRYVGIIPNGVVTESGLISTITFKAIASGEAVVSIIPSSKILLNDGQGTEASAEFGRALYSITPQPPAGVQVFSDTHPFESTWYKNKHAIVNWEKNTSSTEFSYLLDDQPATTPDETVDGSNTTVAYQDLQEGLNYFHIKAKNQGVWGNTTHFLLRIDTLAPASFQPAVEVIEQTGISRYLVSFLTTDSLSGIDHYEVAVIDKTESATISPVFVQAESPYQLNNPSSHPLRVIVRAVDGAGNTRDQSIDLDVAASMTLGAKVVDFLKTNLVLILVLVLALILLLLLLHYLFNHRIYSRMKDVAYLMKHEDEVKKIEEEIHAEEIAKKTLHPPGQSPQPKP